MVWLHFGKIQVVNQPEIAPNTSLLVVCNHISWWDGMLLYEINRRYFKKRFHALAGIQQLKKSVVINLIGVFGLDKKSVKDLWRSLKYSASLLDSPKNMLLIYPQGQIQSPLNPKFTVNMGVYKIWLETKADTQMLFVFLIIEHDAQKPTCYFYSQNSHLSNTSDFKTFENAYLSFVENAKNEHITTIEKKHAV